MKRLNYIFLFISLFSLGTILNSCSEDDVINKAPKAKITSPSDNSNFSEGIEITFTCEASDPEDGTIPDENISWLSTVDGNLGTGKIFTVSDLTSNTHKIILTATDKNLNIDVDTITVTIFQDTNPNIVITSPNKDITLPQGSEITFKCLANDMTDGDLTGESIVWESDKDGVIGTGVTLITSSLSKNIHKITATATDSNGKASSDDVVVNIIENTPPTIKITSPSESDEYSEIEAIDLTCNASDNYDGNLTGESIVWKSDIAGELGTGNSLTIAGLTEGEHKIIAIATDSDGNSSSDTVTIQITYVDKLSIILSRMAGSFSSEAQSLTSNDPYHFDVRRKVTQIWTNETDGFWIYLEQAYASSENDPYFQRVYHFFEEDGVIKNIIYKLNDEESFVGSWASPEDFDNITTSDLTERDNCGLIFVPQADGGFYGTTSGKECYSTIPGVSYMTSEQWLYEDQCQSWDLGWNQYDTVVMGPYSPYIFDRI